ncbi:MAG: flagellar basal body-associated FliL family protein [Clostridiales bacterium]|nr:flagellar basal body-associated FliL family protein [Clostridiales bacterium]
MKSTLTVVLIILTCLTVGMLIFVFSTGNGADANIIGTEENVKPEIKDSVSFSPGTSIITNIKDSNKYLRIMTTFEVASIKTKEFFQKNEYKIKDAVICVLRNKSEAELMAPDAQELLKTSIKDAIAAIIDTKGLIEVYIDEYVIQ